MNSAVTFIIDEYSEKQMYLYSGKENVAQYLSKKIKESGKKQSEISRQVGYINPNIITMFKQGRTRIPLDKIGPIATALEINPGDLFHRVMAEYMPETFEALLPFLGSASLTHQESLLLDAYREACQASNHLFVIFKSE